MTSIKTAIDKNKTINRLKVLAGLVVPQYGVNKDHLVFRRNQNDIIIEYLLLKILKFYYHFLQQLNSC